MKIGHQPLDLAALRRIAREAPPLELEPACLPALRGGHDAVERIVRSGKAAYGINTGFGRLSQTRIPVEELEELQTNIVLSHAAGTGTLVDDTAVRLILALKIFALATGHSGVRPLLVERLLELYNGGVYPCIPAKGSVGASGDLAPLAHLSLALLGIGDVRVKGKRMPAREAIKAPIVVGRDHLDAGSVASPNRETEAMRDGTDAVSDWPLLNLMLNTASGATWVSFHHGGGVGMGYSQHAGMVIVCDGTEAAAKRIERVLWNDPASGVIRHADAGYAEAIACAAEKGLDLPMRR